MQVEDKNVLLNPDVRIKRSISQTFPVEQTVLLPVVGLKPFLDWPSSGGFNHKVLADRRGNKLAHRLQEFTPLRLGGGHHAWV